MNIHFNIQAGLAMSVIWLLPGGLPYMQIALYWILELESLGCVKTRKCERKKCLPCYCIGMFCTMYPCEVVNLN